jgi:arylsulfatase A-like enzyme
MKLNRRDMMKLMGSTALLGATHPLFAQTKRKPNIIYILGDNHTANVMGNAGHPFIKTPGMDRLFNEGLRFSRTYNTTSLCSSSRASILTGTYTHKHGILNNHTSWKQKSPLFLEHLAKHGYRSAFMGKWHMPGKGLPHFPSLETFLSYTYREGQGSYYDCPLIINGKEVAATPGKYITAEITDYGLDFIEKGLKEKNPKPFCLYLSHRAAHPPFKSPAHVRGMYDAIDVKKTLPKNVDPYWFGKTNYHAFQGTLMGSYYDQYRKFCETITAMDEDILRLLNKLDEWGIANNTVVIYMGDNGMQWGNHGHHGIREPYEDVSLLPFLIRAPGLIKDPGSVREQLALNIDVAPTLLDLAGIPKPAFMDGQSLVPILKDGARKGREAFLMEYWRYFPENTPTYHGVITQRYKYIKFERGRDPWFFDLKEDREEKHNLYPKLKGSALLTQMEARLARFENQRAPYLVDFPAKSIPCSHCHQSSAKEV